jgi:hypothetical protein
VTASVATPKGRSLGRGRDPPGRGTGVIDRLSGRSLARRRNWLSADRIGSDRRIPPPAKSPPARGECQGAGAFPRGFPGRERARAGGRWGRPRVGGWPLGPASGRASGPQFAAASRVCSTRSSPTRTDRREWHDRTRPRPPPRRPQLQQD